MTKHFVLWIFFVDNFFSKITQRKFAYILIRQYYLKILKILSFEFDSLYVINENIELIRYYITLSGIVMLRFPFLKNIVPNTCEKRYLFTRKITELAYWFVHVIFLLLKEYLYSCTCQENIYFIKLTFLSEFSNYFYLLPIYDLLII